MRVVVCGGSVAGLGAALVLARRGHAVTILERDDAELPPSPARAWGEWDRKGVAQLRQFHAYTSRTRLILRALLPDVLDALFEAGAEETDLIDEMRRMAPTDLAREPGDDDLVIIRCRRTTLEWVFRDRALAEPNIEWRPATRVLGLTTDGKRVTGVSTDAGIVDADFVVDATGRRSSLAKWLEAAGLPVPVDQESETGVVYFTRWYKVQGLEAAGAGVRMELDYTRCLLAATDDGHASLAFMAAADDVALRGLGNDAAFQAVAESLPRMRKWINPERAEPLTKVLFMGGLRNRWRSVAVPGVAPVGDALLCTNPYYGRGVALGLVSVTLLADALDGGGVGGGDGGDPALSYAAAAAEELEPWYHDGARYDYLRTLWLRDARGEELGPDDAAVVHSDETRFHRSVLQAAVQDESVMRAYMRWLQTLEPPECLTGNEAVRKRVLDLVPTPQAQPGLPSREEILAVLAAHAPAD